MLIIASLTIIFSYLFIWLPYRQAREVRLQSEFEEKMYAFKLIAIRRYYPFLKKFSFQEIEEKYDVEQVYNMIGRA